MSHKDINRHVKKSPKWRFLVIIDERSVHINKNNYYFLIMFFGSALILIGFIFLLQNLGIISAGAWSVFWPCIIILLGLSFIFKRKKNSKWREFGEGMRKFGEEMHKTFNDKNE